MTESFCTLCQRQEFSKKPNGKRVKQKSDATAIICSTCTQLCMSKSLPTPPWEGKEEMKNMIDIRKNRKLKTRRK